MKKNLKVICLLFSTVVLLQSKLYSQENHNDDHIIYITLPVWAVPEDVKIDGENHKALYRYAINYINEKAKSSTHISGEDKIIIFKDLLGNAILPEKDQNNLPESISGNELTFTYNSPTQPWSPAEIARLNVLFGDFYPVAKQILGNPLFNISVNVTKDTSIFSAYAGLYFAGSNEMVLRDTIKISTICHEMIHAFRDDYIMGIGTFEEGMTRAAECEVFNILQGYTHPSGDFHSYFVDHYYDGLNRGNIATKNGYMWTNITLSFFRYQLGGYIWAKNLIEDSDFLFNFNKRLYDRTLIDPSTPSNKSLLIGIVNYIKSSTEGIPISIWMDRQHLLNSSPPSGYFLYHRLNQNTIDYFHRDNLGNEQPQNGATINWSLYNHSNTLLGNGNGVTGAYGWIDFYPTFPTGYIGKIKVVSEVNSPNGILRDSGYFYSISSTNTSNLGFFGVVEDANFGLITVTPLDTNIQSQTQSLVNGSFSFPDFENIRGRFRISFLYNNCQQYSRIITKDASRYFVSVKKDPNYMSSFATIYQPDKINFCTGGNVVLSTTHGINMNYQWYKNNVAIQGANLATYTVTKTGTYKVTVSNTTGCNKTSAGMKIYGPPNAAVTVGGPLEICPPDSLQLTVPYALTNTYQWKLNGVNISGATGNEYYATNAGSYKVKITDVFGCSKTSPTKNIIVICPSSSATSLKSSILKGVFQITPNPANDLIFITGQDEIITIVNLFGQTVRQITNAKSESCINVADLDEGMYLLKSDNSTERLLICR